MLLNRDAEDPYEVLGLSRAVTDDEAKKRARELLDKYADDHTARTAINEAFKRIKEQPSPVEVNGTTVVPLLVSETPETVERGGEVTVQVTDHAGDPVSDARLRREDDGKRMGRTDGDGKDTVRFTDPGTYTVTAGKQEHPQADHQYKKGKVEIRSERKSQEWGGQKENTTDRSEREDTQTDISGSPSTVGGDPNADNPYEVLRLSREATKEEAKAHARELLNEYADNPDARTAIKEAYEAIKKRPSPVEINGTTIVPLLVFATPGRVEVGKDVTVQVTNHIGDPVSGAGLRREDNGRRIGKTDDDGRDTVQFFEPNTYTVVAGKQSHPEPGHEYKDGGIAVRVEDSDQ